MDELTPRQAEILEFIRQHMRDPGYPPTRAEICRAMGFRSPNAAEEHLRAMVRKGAIDMAPGASRGIRLKQETGIPVVGRVAAGSPMLAASGYVAQVDEDACAGCGTCELLCPFDAIHVDGWATVEWQKCMGCGICESQCTVHGITLVRDERRGIPLDVRALAAQSS